MNINKGDYVLVEGVVINEYDWYGRRCIQFVNGAQIWIKTSDIFNRFGDKTVAFGEDNDTKA